ncbi:MAG: ribonuclease III [Candidatus Komeilibacteria bacterium RIFCSPLOWO2_02_FULL_48_11]|uniref:Ribonuclease 3 n=1 Tax=Candidatus Komeilibacteria bacterium RIFCSPLOWO2_02_FULL_48_11 TaxID=1798553 RepID=A0A1G2BS54_9BACT|nr:MAG: ribonuclease III [Candidatus Komeilibacteria bacterium RIFCSPLOWO2_02_FULL_48_11]
MKDILPLEKTLGLGFNNKNLLRQAMVHRSYLNENPSFELDHNERLEFLGDAVLEMAVTEHLYTNFPNPEGELTNWRAALVNANNLASVARTLEIEDYLYLSRGESKDKNTKARNYILANAMEALIGAIYLDQGYQIVKEFIERHILAKLAYIIEHKLYLDSKTKFQEATQEKIGLTPTYRVIRERGPDHNKEFVVGVYIGDELVAEGLGTSKQEAETAAAEAGLKAKGWE